MNNTLERLIKVFNAVFETSLTINDVSADTNLREDLSINSIGLLYVAMALEEEFSVKFTNDDFKEIITVGNVLDCLEKKMK
ncbi:MAG: phosphopantetheine-binding protein [Eubacteriales bacterium]|nr:phosphopantetheine-binding protein [Eubacteriales bacterium]